LLRPRWHSSRRGIELCCLPEALIRCYRKIRSALIGDDRVARGRIDSELGHAGRHRPSLKPSDLPPFAKFFGGTHGGRCRTAASCEVTARSHQFSRRSSCRSNMARPLPVIRYRYLRRTHHPYVAEYSEPVERDSYCGERIVYLGCMLYRTRRRVWSSRRLEDHLFQVVHESHPEPVPFSKRPVHVILSIPIMFSDRRRHARSALSATQARVECASWVRKRPRWKTRHVDDGVVLGSSGPFNQSAPRPNYRPQISAYERHASIRLAALHHAAVLQGRPR
jgi:hypothetical protein